METCCVKLSTDWVSISTRLLQFTIIVNSLTFSHFSPITSMLITKLTLFLRYADWLTCRFERFSIFILQVIR